ncbi:beta-lactamase domain protein [Hyaloraphidium curvatum]|nr:beta-lactamase domain protein [Hyaloraphidium curvatum]
MPLCASPRVALSFSMLRSFRRPLFRGHATSSASVPDATSAQPAVSLGALTSIELNNRSCKTYILADPSSRACALVDPLRDNVPLYLAYMAYHGLKLETVLDTHTHADHVSGAFELRRLTGARYAASRESPAPRVDVHLRDGDSLPLGTQELLVWATPGHTPDSLTVLAGRAAYTGDVLLIGGTGRTDFAGGDAGQSYASAQRLFSLPDETLVFPAHDYRFNTSSTIGRERATNPRLAGKTLEEYRHIMENLGLPLPDKIMESLQMNATALDDKHQLKELPTYPQLNAIRQIRPHELAALLASGPDAAVAVDVRLPEEFAELPKLPSAIEIPLHLLPSRIAELEPHRGKRVVLVCRAGVRSATAAALLNAMGFGDVYNLAGGMLEWERVLGKP